MKTPSLLTSQLAVGHILSLFSLLNVRSSKQSAANKTSCLGYGVHTLALPLMYRRFSGRELSAFEGLFLECVCVCLFTRARAVFVVW